MNEFYFHQRDPTLEGPSGVTVSKTESLPEGDFEITEYFWDDVSLWFLDDQQFTADEREAARHAIYGTPFLTIALQ